MHKEEIIKLLDKEYQELIDWLNKQPNETWEKGPEGKWTTGQHILHLIDALKKINRALSYPKFILKKKFGIANREVRSYEAVAKKYQEKLIQYQDKAATYNKGMKVPLLEEKKELLNLFQIQHKKLQYKVNKWKDKHLDTVIIPHPLMGKMPVRELVMWTAHHTAHHRKTLKAHH